MNFRTYLIAAVATVFVAVPQVGLAASTFTIDLGDGGSEQLSSAMKMVSVLTFITLAPSLILTMTSFVRIITVLSLLKTALGTQTAPPQQVVTGLAIFLTAAIMWPVGTEVYTKGLGPYLEDEIPGKEALYRSIKPLKEFMIRQTRESDLLLINEIQSSVRPETLEDIGLQTLIPAFVISELRTGFEMGFLIFLPFLLLDIVVSSITMSLGLVMLPPALLSMPLKIMLFVLADGWNMIVGSLVRSFG